MNIPVRDMAFRPYLPGLRGIERIHPIAWDFPPRAIPVLDWPCETEVSYARGLRDLWDFPAHIMVIEHDILDPRGAMVELFDCPEAACVAMYRLYPASTGWPEPVWAHRTVDEEGGLHFIPEWQEWVPYAGLGLAKLSYNLRSAITAPPLVPWQDLDTELSRHLATQWHVHKTEVEHLHR